MISSANGDGVLWLIKAYLAASRNGDAGDQAEAGFLNRRALDAFAFEVSDGSSNVIAHQIQFVISLIFGRMYSQLRRRQREDQPSMACIDGRKIEHVAKEDANLFCIMGVNKRVNTGNHRQIILESLELPK